MKFWRNVAKIFWVVGLTLALLGHPWLTAESQAAFGRKQSGRSPQPSTQLTTKVAEVSPPAIFQELRQELDNYQPQVSILSPRSNEVLTADTVSVRFQVKDLSIYKNKKFGLGPHLHVLLDNRPYQAVYDVTKPLVLENLNPGTHTIRAITSRPWHETFKNDGAFAQLTFHVFAKTGDNSPNPDLPLLTYSRPQGSYGAEPIMLDYYLTNAPLHLVAQANPQDDIADWRIRVTVNGNSFVVDRWQPIYLKGFKPGKNWVQIEYLDESGNPVKNVFNNTVRLITYEPGGTDPLSQLVRGELTLADVKGIVDPNYTPPELPKPTPTPTPFPAATPTATPTPSPQILPTPLTQPAPAVSPTAPATPQAIESPKPQPAPNAVKSPAAELKNKLEPAAKPERESKQPAPIQRPSEPPTTLEKLTAPTQELINSSKSAPENQSNKAGSGVKERLQPEPKRDSKEVPERSPVAPLSAPPTPANSAEPERRAKAPSSPNSSPVLEESTTLDAPRSAPLETVPSPTSQPVSPKSFRAEQRQPTSAVTDSATRSLAPISSEPPSTRPTSPLSPSDSEASGITELRQLIRRIRQTIDQPASTVND